MPDSESRAFDSALSHVATVATFNVGRRDLVELHSALVLHALADLSAAATPETLAASIRSRLGIAIEIGNVVDAIGRLDADGKLRRENNFAVALGSDARREIQEQTRSGDQLRRVLTAEWLDSIDQTLSSRMQERLNALQRVQLEADLDLFVSQLVRYHGVEVATFLYPAADALRNQLLLEDDSLYSVLGPSADEVLSALRREFLPRFVREATPRRAVYIADRLHRAFVLQVLQVDASASQLFRDAITPKDLFLDTNFVFRALGLQGEVLRTTAREVLTLSKRLGHDLWITTRTLAELEYVVKQQSEWLARGPDIPEYLAGVASEFIARNDYVSAYWKNRVRTGITANEFRERFSNIQLQLENLEISLFALEGSNLPSAEQITVESSALKSYKPSADHRVVEHDVFHKLFIERRRESKAGREPFGWYEATDLFLTFDNSLPTYALERAGQQYAHRVPFCLMANEWLQLLYFVCPDVDIEPTTFVSLINSPYLESYFSASAIDRDVVRRIVGTMAEVGEYRPEVARKIFTDRAIRKRLNAARNQEEVAMLKEAIRSTGREEDQRVQQLLKEQENRIRDLEYAVAASTTSSLGEKGTTSPARSKKRLTPNSEVSKLREDLKKIRVDVVATTQLRDDVTQLRSEVDRASMRARAAERWLFAFPVALVFWGATELTRTGGSRTFALFAIVAGITPVLVGIWSRFAGRLWEYISRFSALVTIGLAVWQNSLPVREAIKAILGVVSRRLTLR
jgi:exonuclease VII large subunit